MIDLHSHFLFDADDGPRTIAESLEMLRLAERDGTTVMVATPHQRHPAGYDVTPDLARSRFEAVRVAAEEAGIRVELRLAAEIHFSEAIPEGIRDGKLFPLSENGLYFLFELPVTTIPGNVFEMVFEFQTRGFFPVLAHPERNFEVMGNPEVARKLHRQGVLIQVTAQSITGGFGRKSEKAAKKLLKWGAVDVIASDTHNATRRPPGLSDAVRLVTKWVGAAEAERLVTEVPGRILRGEGVP